MEFINAKDEAQPIRGTEVREIPGPIDPTGEEWAGVNSNNDGNFSSGIIGETRPRRYSDYDRLTGGIITQLIKDAEDQLGEARACIEWYGKKEQEQLERLENFRKLQEIEQHLLQDHLSHRSE